MFLALAIVTGLLAGWLHFRMDYTGHTEVANTRRNRVLASTPLLVVAVIMVVLEVGSMAKGAAQRYPVYTTAKANVDALASGLSNDQLRDGRRRARRSPTRMPACCNLFRVSASAQYGPLGGENPVGFTPNGVSDTLEPAEPVTANPGTVNSDGSPNEPNVGIGYAAGTGGGYGPEGVNGSRVFLPFGLDPKRTPVMGSYGENTVAAKATSAWYQLPPRTPDRPLVTVAAAGAIWYYDEEGGFNYGQSPQTAVGRAPARRQLPGAGSGPADRHLRRKRPGATCVSRWPGRRRRPTSRASSPTTRTCPTTSGSRSPRRACRCSRPPTDPRIADPGADGHRHRRELPVPAAVLRTPRRGRTAAVPHPAELQAGGGVVEPVAVRRGRRPVPVHPGAAAHVDRSRPICATTGTATGAPSSATTAWCLRRMRPTPSSIKARMRVFGWSRSGPIRALP